MLLVRFVFDTVNKKQKQSRPKQNQNKTVINVVCVGLHDSYESSPILMISAVHTPRIVQ